MDFAKMGNAEYKMLPNYSNKRKSELSNIFINEVNLLNEYEELLCRLTIVLGHTTPKGITDKSIRDILADIFDFLYISRRLIFQNYGSVAFPLLRRAFESISLMVYLIYCPEKALDWDKGKEIKNAEVRNFLDSHPLGESGKLLKESYTFYSGATHPNREYIPSRFLGEGNKFVLGAIGPVNLLIIADFILKLIQLWFWFGATISYYYLGVYDKIDKSYGKDYLRIGDKANIVAENLAKYRNELIKKRNK